jgi:ABC-type Zn2+ transport system substrate-binding protein/surface adhesin
MRTRLRPVHDPALAHVHQSLCLRAGDLGALLRLAALAVGDEQEVAPFRFDADELEPVRRARQVALDDVPADHPLALHQAHDGGRDEKRALDLHSDILQDGPHDHASARAQHQGGACIRNMRS